MTAAVAAPGVEVTRALLSYTTRHKVSDAVAALLQKAADASASNTLELCESLQKKRGVLH